MARKPKTQPSTEAAAATPAPELATAPARRGRKPKAATPSPALPLMVRDDDRAADAAKGSAIKAGPTQALGHRGPGRKPKTQPSTEAAAATPVPELATAPARQGRKPKAATPSPALPLMVSDDERAADTAKSGAYKAGPTKTPGRRSPGRKPKHRADAEAATLPQDTAIEHTGATTYPSAIGLEQGAAKDDAPVAERVGPLDKAGAVAGVEGASRTASAAHWDRATDAVRFDWPAIERVAAAVGPNQGMAKLLVAARAEGAQSRWPF